MHVLLADEENVVGLDVLVASEAEMVDVRNGVTTSYCLPILRTFGSIVKVMGGNEVG
jgi:hypothetical protein